MSFLSKEITLPKLRMPQVGSPAVPRPKARASRASFAGAVTGLEIGATQVIAAEARVSDGIIVARRVVARDLPAGLVRDGLIVDSAALAGELKSLFSEHKLGRRVRVGLATPRTILRVIDLPPLDDADVPSALMLQARDRIPMPIDRAVLDHQSFGLVETPEGTRLRVIVVATEREGVDTLLGSLRQAGLRPEGIDLSVFAAMRAVADADPLPGPVLHAQLGDLVNIAIAESGVCQFTRQAPQGLAFVLERLVELSGGTPREARARLLAAGAPEAGDADPAAVREVGALLGRVAGELGSELRAAAEFYGTQAGVTVTHGVITGPLAPLRGFADALAEASGLDLRCGTASVCADDALGGVDACIAPVAVGLAIGSVAR